MLGKSMRSELIKGKHSLFYLLHVILPLLAIVVIKLYYGFGDRFSLETKLDIYFTCICAALPVGIAWMIAVSVGWEEENHFQRLMTQQSRLISVISKLLILYLSGLVTVIIVLLGCKIFVDQSMSLSFMAWMLLIFAAVSMILYLIHFMLNLRFGKTLSILASFFGSVIGMTLITGLGDQCWQWIPYSMLDRLAQYLLSICYGQNESLRTLFISEMQKAVPSAVIYLVVLSTILCVWIRRWEGRVITE